MILHLDNQLYKIWNRMSSGSYMAEPVKLIQIPKVGGSHCLPPANPLLFIKPKQLDYQINTIYSREFKYLCLIKRTA